MNLDQRIMAEFKRRGKRPSQASTAEAQAVVWKVTTPREKVAGAAGYVQSKAREAVKRTVPLTVLTFRESQCVGCDQYERLADGAGLCRECGCSAAMLRTKQKDPKQRCPARVPKWTEYEGDDAESA